jgi:hypothetical protein
LSNPTTGRGVARWSASGTERVSSDLNPTSVKLHELQVATLLIGQDIRFGVEQEQLAKLSSDYRTGWASRKRLRRPISLGMSIESSIVRLAGLLA